MTYLSAAELAAVQTLHKRAPYVVAGTSGSMFSIARHYGGMTFNGSEYIYHPPTDECVRMDVVKFVATLRKPKRAKVVEADMFKDAL